MFKLILYLPCKARRCCMIYRSFVSMEAFIYIIGCITLQASSYEKHEGCYMMVA